MKTHSEDEKEISALDVNKDFIRGDIIDFLAGYGIRSTNCKHKKQGMICGERDDIRMIIFPDDSHNKMLIAFNNGDEEKITLGCYEMRLLGSNDFIFSKDGD